ncbi:MAG TPA: hypothetical protein VJ453_02100 [Terriglobales bacterium]|jgi:hypothetical protein|nr:hypothetical protein [Terriglobales bacterium]
MLRAKHDLVKVLETELRFLDKGGYQDSQMWRPQFIFLDSPSCIHPAGSGRPKACKDCSLVGFVPKPRLSAPVPCHHIPLTKEGFTVDSLSRWGTHEELESALRSWLKEKIQALNRHERPQACSCEEKDEHCSPPMS